MEHLLSSLSDAIRRHEDTVSLWNELFSRASMTTQLDEQQQKQIATIFNQVKRSEHKKVLVREFMKSLRQAILSRPKVTRHLLEQMLPPNLFPRSIHKYSNWKKVAPVLDYLRYLLFGAPTRKFQEQLSGFITPIELTQITQPVQIMKYFTPSQYNKLGSVSKSVSQTYSKTGQGIQVLDDRSLAKMKHKRLFMENLTKYRRTLKVIRLHDEVDLVYDSLLDSSEWDAFFKALPSLTNLEELDLRPTRFYFKRRNANGKTKALAAALPSLTKLKVLKLRCCIYDSSGRGNKGALLIAETLPSMTNLEHLGLDRNNIGDEGAASIAHVLPSLTKLKHINLSDNWIRNEGAIAIAQALPSLTELETLDLRWNAIGYNGAVAIVHALQTLTKFKKLDLRGIRIGEEEKVAIAQIDPSLTNSIYL